MIKDIAENNRAGVVKVSSSVEDSLYCSAFFISSTALTVCGQSDIYSRRH
jgi:hypothetical protein